MHRKGDGAAQPAELIVADQQGWVLAASLTADLDAWTLWVPTIMSPGLTWADAM